MRSIVLAASLCLIGVVKAQDPPLIPAHFVWPDVQPGVLPDVRLSSVVHEADDTARNATTRASLARSAAAHAKRRSGMQQTFGIKPNQATLDDGTTISAPRSSSGAVILGTVSYPSGATMTGAFGPDLGVLQPSPESALLRFSGWVWGASSKNARPITGIFEWKNGDVFTGEATGDGSTSMGTYVRSDGQERFVGVIDLSQTEIRPVKGYLESASGKLLAVVYRN